MHRVLFSLSFIKKCTALTLCALLLSLCACGAPDAAPAPEAAAKNERERSAEPPDGEYERAIWYGFVPDELIDASPQSIVTWAAYCKMLGSMIELSDESALPEWQSMTANAPTDKNMYRAGGMLCLLCAAELIGSASFNAATPKEFMEYSDTYYEKVSWVYPILPYHEPITIDETCSDTNHVGPMYDFTVRRVSSVSKKPLLEFDENGDLGIQKAFTLQDAAVSVLRLYESRNIGRLEPAFVPVSEVGTFELPESLREKALLMPKPLPDQLPNWNGIHTKIEDMEYLANRTYYAEEDVARIADMGCFNFIGLGYEHWWYTKEVDGALLVDEAVLQNIDDFVCWCIERGIHVCFNTCSVPGFLVQAAEGYVDDILENPVHYRQAVELCQMLARRYADVPSNAMSFFLIGEPSRGYFTEESYKKLIDDLSLAMHAHDAEKILFTAGLCECTDQFYTFPVDNLGDSFTVPSFNAYIDPQMYWFWPNVFVNGCVSADDPAPLTLQGDFMQGTEVTLWIRYIDRYADIQLDDLILSVSDDRSELLQFDCGALSQGEEMDCVNGLPVTITLPSDTKSLAIRAISPQKDGCRNVNLVCITLSVPSDTETTYAVPVINGQTFWRYETAPRAVTNIWCAEIPSYMLPDFEPSTVTVHADGTYENHGRQHCYTEETVEDYVSLWAERNALDGKAAWCCEWGLPFSLPLAARTGFVRQFMTSCRARGVPCCMFWSRPGDWGPAIHESALESGHLALPADWEEQGYSYVDGYYYDTAVMDVMREFLE